MSFEFKSMRLNFGERLFRTIPLTSILALTVGQASAGDREGYLTVVLGSVHFDAELNDFNPGILVGTRWILDSLGREYHLEGGIFYNSYEEASPIIMWGLSQTLFETGSLEVRGGISFGTGFYGKLAPHLKLEYSIPNMGGFIPLAAATLSVRVDNVEYRFSVLPGDDAFGALNLSVATRF